MKRNLSDKCFIDQRIENRLLFVLADDQREKTAQGPKVCLTGLMIFT